jgi:hypothetical protein
MEQQDIRGSCYPQADRDRVLGNKYAKRSAMLAAQTVAPQKPSLPSNNAGKIACYLNSKSTGLVVLQRPEVGPKVHWLSAVASIEPDQNLDGFVRFGIPAFPAGDAFVLKQRQVEYVRQHFESWRVMKNS